jgi:serine/threonine protein phosphatase PrpC
VVNTPPARTPRRIRRVPSHLPNWWPIVEWTVRLALLAAILMLLAPLFMARLGLAEEMVSTGKQTSASTTTPSQEEHGTVKRPTTKSRRAKTAPAANQEETSDDTTSRVDALPEVPKTKVAQNKPPEAPSGPHDKGSPTTLTPSWPVTSAGRAADRKNGAVLSSGKLPADQPSITPDIHGSTHLGVETFVGVAFLGILGYLGWDRRRLAERLSRVESALDLQKAEPLSSGSPDVEAGVPGKPPEAPALFTAASPEVALTALIREAKSRRLGTLPSAASRPWGAGVASITGNVRRENQDAAIAFEVGSSAVLIVADGLGGLPHGQEAARLAVGAAALSIAEDLGRETAAPALPELIAEKGLLEAASALCCRARAEGWVSNTDGFRTTLVAVVATPAVYGYVYLGDGGGVVLRQSGAPDSFLVPQKVDGVANIVAGSLGPVIQGSPVVGRVARRAGDALLIGTDGVFDRVANDFGQSVTKLLAGHNGDAQAVASLVVSDFASAKEGTRYVCDDNMSLAILCTPLPRPAEADLPARRMHAVRK